MAKKVFCYEIGGFSGARYGTVYMTEEGALAAAKKEFERLTSHNLGETVEARAGFEKCLEERFIRVTRLNIEA